MSDAARCAGEIPGEALTHETFKEARVSKKPLSEKRPGSAVSIQTTATGNVVAVSRIENVS
jgi:hypothetical protein